LDKKFRGILEELCDYQPEKDDLLIEYRAQQIIASAHNLLKHIQKTYEAETAKDLTGRLLRSIASGDEEKFNRKLRSIRENKKPKI
jgi:hypothetical protein